MHHQVISVLFYFIKNSFFLSHFFFFLQVPYAGVIYSKLYKVNIAIGIILVIILMSSTQT